MAAKTSLDALCESDFRDRIHDQFSCNEQGADAQSFELLEVSPLGASPDADQRHAFSLLFRDRSARTPEQRVYPLKHAELGNLELFLVPLGPDDSGMLYEAVFT